MVAAVSGYLPVEQGVACWAALHRATDTAKAFGDPRSRDQIMADTLVERLTGQKRADTVPLDVRITDHPDNPPDDDTGTPADGRPQPGPRGPAGDSGTGGAPGTDGAGGAPGPTSEAGRTADVGEEPGGDPAETARLVLPAIALERLRDHADGSAGVRLLVPWPTLRGGNRPACWTATTPSRHPWSAN